LRHHPCTIHHTLGAVAPVSLHEGQIKIPAMVAVWKHASDPATIARKPSRAKSERRFGANDPKPPIWIAMELKFENPHRA
jgi:hypothetical protein